MQHPTSGKYADKESDISILLEPALQNWKLRVGSRGGYKDNFCKKKSQHSEYPKEKTAEVNQSKQSKPYFWQAKIDQIFPKVRKT